MYVLVEHDVAKPADFWSAADALQIPSNISLLHTFAATDGSRAVCLWESDSVDSLRRFLDGATEGMARNEYFEVPNREGVVFPSMAAAGARR